MSSGTAGGPKSDPGSGRPVAPELSGRVPLVAASYAVITRGARDVQGTERAKGAGSTNDTAGTGGAGAPGGSDGTAGTAGTGGTVGPGATEVLLQLRRGTGYMDGWWACGAAGHVEDAGAASTALALELGEELGVRATELRPLTTVQRGCLLGPLEQRADFFFHVTALDGEPRLLEQDKAAELRWWPLHALPDLVVPHERAVLEALARELAGGDRVPPLIELGFAQRLVLVAAVGHGGVIGTGDAMPWHLPEDLRRFKAMTMGGVMVMGRRTWESIGRALPGRTTVVLTSDLGWSAPGALVAHSLPEAVLVAGDREVFVVGGGEIYAQTIDLASRLEITHVDLAPEGEVRFPPIDPQVWVETRREPGEGMAFVTYERR